MECLYDSVSCINVSKWNFNSTYGNQKENTLIVVPIVGKNREIPEQKINQFVSDRTDMIEIMDGEKVILRVSDQFHGYEELKKLLRRNTEEIMKVWNEG